MTPYRDPQTPEERSYNRLFCCERTIIERVIGQLKRRFSILKSEVRIATDRIPSVIVACAVMHNVAKRLGDEAPEEEGEQNLLEDPDDEAEDQEDIAPNIRQLGQQRRLELAQIIHQRRRQQRLQN